MGSLGRYVLENVDTGRVEFTGVKGSQHVHFTLEDPPLKGFEENTLGRDGVVFTVLLSERVGQPFLRGARLRAKVGSIHRGPKSHPRRGRERLLRLLTDFLK